MSMQSNTPWIGKGHLIESICLLMLFLSLLCGALGAVFFSDVPVINERGFVSSIKMERSLELTAYWLAGAIGSAIVWYVLGGIGTALTWLEVSRLKPPRVGVKPVKEPSLGVAVADTGPMAE